MTHLLSAGLALACLIGQPVYQDETVASKPLPSSAEVILNVEQCVAQALKHSAKVEEAQAKVDFFLARLAEMNATAYPKIMATAFLAPMYTVRGDGFERNPTVRFRHARDWGPFVNIEAHLVQPLYSFGRGKAAKMAARERSDVERARLEQVMLTLARETRKLYYLRLYALSMQPALDNAQRLLADASNKAEGLHAHGGGDVTQVDLARLSYGSAELERRIGEAEHGARIALTALKQAMGFGDAYPLVQADKTLPIPTEEQLVGDLPPLAQLLGQAASERPEWAELAHGRRAAAHWATAERLALLPQLLFVGQANFAYTPTRDRDPNPWHYDIYNRRTGGFALVLKFDLDAGTTLAKAKQADMTRREVLALQRYAATGIPLEVKAAHEALLQLQGAVRSTAKGVLATRKWMRFAANALATGTGEARDLLEGTANYLQAKQAQMSAVQSYHGKLADLTYAVGHNKHL